MPLPYAFPIPTITSVSRTRVGWRDGCDATTITFTFDRPVSAWEVRVGSPTYADGEPADAWRAPRYGLGQGPFGLMPFGGYTEDPPVNGGQAVVTAADLLHGHNRVQVYGRSVENHWTPAAEPVPAAP